MTSSMNSIKSKKILPITLLLLSLLGIFIAAYLTYIHYMVTGGDANFASFCNVNAKVNCDAVAASAWSTLFGVPVSIWGMLFYVFFWGLNADRLAKNIIRNNTVYQLLLATAGIGFTAFLIAISKIILDTWCLLCAALWIINLFIFILAFKSNTHPFKSYPKILWQDLLWFFKKWYRLVLILLVLSTFVATLFYTAHHERQIKQTQLDQPPIFNELISPISLTGPAHGADSPRLTIVEFSDFQCPHCKKLHDVLSKITRENKKIRVIHKDFPLDHHCHPLITKPFHQNACQASVFVRCAGQQGKYWEAFDQTFELSRELEDATTFDTLTSLLELNKDQLTACMSDPKITEGIKQDLQEGIDNGIDATPVVIFNGTDQLLSGWSEGKLEKAIQFWMKKK
ncbi:MAG: vitamin K epoxide reductase [uncultured bacterium]|nr:MAG: vitamin K epoxide reductase [uncultured bacterium]